MDTPFERKIEWGYRLLLCAAGVGLLGLGLAFGAIRNADTRARVSTQAQSALADHFPVTQPPDPADWLVFDGGPPADRTATGHPLMERFRLAGTFLVPADASGQGAVRKAIVDDLSAGQQRMVSEGDLLEPALRVERIEVERILLDAAGETLVLELNFRGGPAAVAAGPEAAPGALATAPETLDSTPYGIRISDHRWVLQRDSLLKYYEGLRDDPERIAQLYETFKPLVEQDRITGYRLGIEGEKEFLSAMGLQENDVIRTVNSMDMVSQGRAEFFVREFVQGRMSAVVLEVERDNVRSKKIYEIR